MHANLAKSSTEKLKRILHKAKKIIPKKLDIFDFLVITAVSTYALIFSHFTILKHYAFESYAADLGIFNQAFYTTIFHGKLFFYTAEQWLVPSGCFFGVHFSPILFFVIPFYAVYPRPETLLVFHSFLLALGALPIYALSNLLLKDKKFSFMIVLIYLLYTPLQGANWFDFHPQDFIPVIVSSTYYFAIRKSWKKFILFAILSLMIEEHLLYIMVMLAIYNILATFSKINAKNLIHIKMKIKSNRALSSILILIICFVWQLITTQVKNLFPPSKDFLDFYRAEGVYKVLGFKEDIKFLPIYVLLNLQKTFEALYYDYHVKMFYIMALFSPVLFICFLHPISILIIAILLPILLTNNLPYYTIGAQYPLYLVPLIFISTVEGLSRLHRKKVAIKTLLKLMILVSLFFTISISPLSPLAYSLSKESILWYPQQISIDENVETLHEILNLIPQNASILTQNHIFPHVSNRINAYLIPLATPQNQKQTEILKTYTRQLIRKSDYILTDLNSKDYWTLFILKEIKNSDIFRPYAITKRAVLFKKNYDGMLHMISPSNVNQLIFEASQDPLISLGYEIKDETSKSGDVIFYPKNLSQGFVIYGPYICLPSGKYNVTYTIKIGPHDKGYLATIDVADEKGKYIIARRDLYGLELKENEWTNVTITFSINRIRTDVEFRLFSTGMADICLDRIILRQLSNKATEEFGTRTFNYEQLIVKGEITKEKIMFHPMSSNYSEIFWYGPYITLPPGSYRVSFFLKIQPMPESGDKVITLDLAKDEGANIIMSLNVYGKTLMDAPVISGWYKITLHFTTESQLEKVEFRGLQPSGKYNIYLAFILLEKIS